MKINSFTKKSLLASIFVTILVASCKKDNNNSNSTPPPPVQNNDSAAAAMATQKAMADNAYDDVLQVALESGSDNKILSIISMAKNGQVQTNSTHSAVEVNGLLTCASYTVSPADTTTFPKTLTVDFGSGCTSADGITRKGKVTFVLSGKMLMPGTTVSATFTGYSVNSYQLQGTYSFTNISAVSGIAYTTKITDGKITFPDATFYNYTGSKTIKMTAGWLTPTILTDDVYSIGGSGSFSTSAGTSIVDSITTLLSKSYSCPFISSGIISFTYDNTLNGTLDFGSGVCDSTVTIKVGQISKNFVLP
ncbi:MAG: hypothetical protein C5B59_05140 [Bacteroidetes bacterium]|nr:MAG: hypothetical protein C5B59_05140 [Bacteroidota bacterium]